MILDISTDFIKTYIDNSIRAKLAVAEVLNEAIAEAGDVLVSALQNGNKILCCGNGGSASDAQHFAAELLGRYIKEREGLPAMALNTDTSTLTAISNDYGYAQVFARQVQALGRADDVLIAITTSGNSENILNAVTAARARNMRIIVLTGKQGGKLAKHLQSADMLVCVPSDVVSHIQEAHIMVLHCWCALIDQRYISNAPSTFKK